MAPSQPAFRQSREPHLHIAGERCSVCDQPISNEKAEDVRARFEARERSYRCCRRPRGRANCSREIANRGRARRPAIEKMQRESVEALQNLRGEIAEREAVAREVGKREADCTLQQKLAAAEKAKAEVEVTTQQRIAASGTSEPRAGDRVAREIATAERGKQEALEHCEFFLKASQEEVVSERVKEVREAMEKDKASALGTERAKHFDETQKLIAKLETVTCQLDREDYKNWVKVQRSTCSKRLRQSSTAIGLSGFEKACPVPISFTLSCTTIGTADESIYDRTARCGATTMSASSSRTRPPPERTTQSSARSSSQTVSGKWKCGAP